MWLCNGPKSQQQQSSPPNRSQLTHDAADGRRVEAKVSPSSHISHSHAEWFSLSARWPSTTGCFFQRWLKLRDGTWAIKSHLSSLQFRLHFLFRDRISVRRRVHSLGCDSMKSFWHWSRAGKQISWQHAHDINYDPLRPRHFFIINTAKSSKKKVCDRRST